jgi:hypothetical protein
VLGLGGHELGKELSSIVSANKPTGPNAKLKDDVPTSFNRITWPANKAVGRKKKMMWVPKGSTPIKAELITQISTARPTLKSEPHMTSKVLLSKHTNKRPILGVTIGHGVFENSCKVKRLQVDIRIIADHIINSHHSMRQCMDKGIYIQFSKTECFRIRNRRVWYFQRFGRFEWNSSCRIWGLEDALDMLFREH